MWSARLGSLTQRSTPKLSTTSDNASAVGPGGCFARRKRRSSNKVEMPSGSEVSRHACFSFDQAMCLDDEAQMTTLSS